LQVSATCSRTGGGVDEPYVGCGQCHLDAPIAALFGEE